MEPKSFNVPLTLPLQQHPMKELGGVVLRQIAAVALAKGKNYSVFKITR